MTLEQQTHTVLYTRQKSYW